MDMGGGWSSDTICEDTDLGLTIQQQGWLTHYTNHRYGHGLLPDTYEDFKKQRHRWAYGGFQIVQKHLGRFFPRAGPLLADQRRGFAPGGRDSPPRRGRPVPRRLRHPELPPG